MLFCFLIHFMRICWHIFLSIDILEIVLLSFNCGFPPISMYLAVSLGSRPLRTELFYYWMSHIVAMHWPYSTKAIGRLRLSKQLNKNISQSNLNVGIFHMILLNGSIFLEYDWNFNRKKLNLSDDSITFEFFINRDSSEVYMRLIGSHLHLVLVFWAEMKLDGKKIVPIIDLQMPISMTSSCLHFWWFISSIELVY